MRLSTLSIVCLSPLFLVFVAMIHDHPPNPTVNPELTIEKSLDVPPRVRLFLRRSCYDCHSSETVWPWYAGVPIASRLIEADVKRGRATMNFSEWSISAGATPGRAASTLWAACEAVKKGMMPKRPYPFLHPHTRPTQADVEMFCEWTTEQANRIRANMRTRAVEPGR